MAVRQVRPHDHFLSGDSRALLELPYDPAELATRYGLHFEDGIDDLDHYLRAAIALPDGSQAWLVKYRGERDAGTTVYVDAGTNPETAGAAVLRVLSLTSEGLRWVTPPVTTTD
jgi:hypothetical protein